MSMKIVLNFIWKKFKEIPPNGHCDLAKRAFRCDDGRCLPRDQVCDISKDCPGGEDEDQDCGMHFYYYSTTPFVLCEQQHKSHDL